MATKQGNLDLLNDPVAQRLLNSDIPARLAYNWSDGTPRVLPIWFHWNGKQIVLAGPPNAPKLKVLHPGTQVAISIDDKNWPYKVLLVRGTIDAIEKINGMVPEYVASAERYLGEGAGGFLDMYRKMFPDENVRVTIQPRWVGIIDMESRFPSAFETAMAA
jgi:hypothetical protein